MTTQTANARAPHSIYLDHAAATPLVPEVAAAMEAVHETGFANPSSPHAAGRQAKRLLEDARERILALVGGDLGADARLVFTSGATEANRLGVLGLAARPRGRILHSTRDHPGAVAAARELEARGWTAASVPLEPDGTLALSSLGAAPDESTEVLCATLVCGQSGTCADPAGLAHWVGAAAGRLVHVDATQGLLAGAIGPGVFGLPPGLAATLAFAPHKFGGPRGVGGLVIRHDVALLPIAPATQEGGLRGGTEPVALAVGFARALELALADRADVAGRVARLRDRLEDRLLTAARAAGVAAIVVGAGAVRAAHLTTVAFPGIDRQALVMAADLEGVCCATGTACASGATEPAPALVAMGLSPAHVAGAVRFSLGRSTSMADVDVAADRIGRVVTRMAPRW